MKNKTIGNKFFNITFNSFSNLLSFKKIQIITYTKNVNFYYMVNINFILC